jgi:molecular chaperone GrpE
MARDNNSNETKENLENVDSSLNQEQTGTECVEDLKECEKGTSCEEIEKLSNELDSKTKKYEEVMDMLQRTAAEFDNYKKRTLREKETLYCEAVSDVVSAFLPVVDSIGRAIQACSTETGGEQSIKEGVELVSKQLKDVLKKLGVEEIASVGEEFNPEYHDAVMHIDDDSYGQNVVVEEFQKGYKFKDKVIRHSIVKVAN